jgi:transglutaminase-like putative cysteine protease
MKYKITHSTSYSYSEPVAVCQNLVMLTPREGPRLRCSSHRLVIRPQPTTSAHRIDFFGNQCVAFSIEENHRQLRITATCRVDVEPFELPRTDTLPAWEKVIDGVSAQRDPDWLEAWPFICDSPRIVRKETFANYAHESFPAGRSAFAAVQDLTARIHRDFKYDRAATDVRTSTDEAFRLQKGVCQDFAHVEIACLRSLGMPARYVSGYLRTVPAPGKERLVGADQSHAWISAYCGPAGWNDFDPTNNAVVSTDHVPLA